MAKRSRKVQKPQEEKNGLVVAAFAEDLEQAKNYEALLKAEDIPVVIDEQNGCRQFDSEGIAVMVPEAFLDEAHVVIESQDAYDDFYDFVLENEDNIDLDDDLFEQDL